MFFRKIVNKIKYACRKVTIHLGLRFFNVDISTIREIGFHIKVRDKERKYECADRLVTLEDYCDTVFSYFSPDLVNMMVIIVSQVNQILLSLPELKDRPDLLIACNKFIQDRHIFSIQLYIGAFDHIEVMGSIDHSKILV